MQCLNCHYSLANLTGPPHRCPECGTAFDPNDPSTFDDGHRETFPASRNEWGLLWLLFGLVVVVVWFLGELRGRPW